jgi:hypothetical protein
MQDQLQAPEQNEQAEAEPVYAVIEVFGHRRLAGRIAEVEQYGTKLLRIDIPEKGNSRTALRASYTAVRLCFRSRIAILRRSNG